MLATEADTVSGQEPKARPFVDPEAAFKLGDTNKDGKLSREEFVKLLSNLPRIKDNPKAADFLFNRLDENKDGFLSLEEFKKIRELAPKKDFPGKKDAPKKDDPKPRADEKPATAEQLAFFEKKIRPVLVSQCFQCHSEEAKKQKGELLLDSRDGMRKGGESGPAIVPGNPQKSLLIKAIKQTDDNLKMPPKSKLSDETVADFEKWIASGAADPRMGKKTVASASKEIDIEKGRHFWAFQPPKPATPPAVQHGGWVRTDIDKFVMAGLEGKGLKPVGDADPRALIRRVYFDLIGLPPSPEEVEAFARDPSPAAYAAVVDKLLNSPQFGERWGRHWLDVARYAESSGKTANFNHPQAWRYRDYVIHAFNTDKPYDQFVKEQLAGDLIPTSDPAKKAERTIATGFLALGPKALNERNGLQFELDLADEQIDVTTQAFLGLTAACARCHDHKFDPIPQRDYYALAGIFRSTETCYGTVRFVQSQRPTPLIELPAGSVPSAITEKLSDKERADIEKQVKDVQERMKNVTDPINNIFNQAQLALLRSKLDSYHADGTPKLLAMGARDKSGFGGFQPKGPPPKKGNGFMGFGGSRSIADSPLYARGEPDKPSEDHIPRGTLRVLSRTPLKIRSTESGRLELAEWIASKDNPLTARVMANRIWSNLFGRGIVPTPDNFGAAGHAPANQALLDYLARTFVADGWSVKKLIRQIVTSHAYQLASTFDDKAFEADPDNDLVWRQGPRRLDAECLRDAMLSVSGQLNLVPPVGSVVAQSGEGPTGRPRLGGQAIVAAINDPRNVHRSVYLPIIREQLPESLSLFDFPDPNAVAGERATTTVPAQSLYLLNNPFVIRQAEFAADRLLASSDSDEEKVKRAYETMFARPPSAKESKAATDFLADYQKRATKRMTWSAFTQALMASAEFANLK
jgi:cytochrome c553